MTCKYCGSNDIIKDGVVRGKQRYFCKKCKRTFVYGDGRTDEEIQTLKALFTLLTTQNNLSYTDLSKIFGRDRSLLHRWFGEIGVDEWRSRVYKDNISVEFKSHQEYEQYIDKLKDEFDTSKPLYISTGNLLDGEFSTFLIIQRNTEKD